MKNEMWRYIFNSELKSYSSITDAAISAKGAGYKLFCWNGDIYLITHEGKIENTGLTVAIVNGETE